MKARFDLEAFNRPVVVLEPAYGDEDILLAAFLRFDSNVLHVTVERGANGRINSVRLRAESSS